ncbi:MAG: helix-turn-helix domain-containing protein [Ignavibacteria bacterium]|nr:helix-turn-helix domain-containing protein [Ignavibacteria bacterium]
MSEPQQTLIVSTTETIQAMITEAVERAILRNEPHHNEAPSVRDLMTFAEVRLALRCSAPTLRKLVRTGKIHASRIGDRWRFRAEDVQLFLTSRGNNG